MRGIVNGLLLSVPVWLLVITALCRPPQSGVDFFVYVLLTAMGVLSVWALLLQPAPSDPPCPDRYLQVLPPLGEQTVDDYDSRH